MIKSKKKSFHKTAFELGLYKNTLPGIKRFKNFAISLMVSCLFTTTYQYFFKSSCSSSSCLPHYYFKTSINIEINFKQNIMLVIVDNNFF